MSLQDYYNGISTGAWKALNPDECGCRGRGWFVSDVDTVHQCSLHYSGQPHPEDDYPDTYEYTDENGVIRVGSTGKPEPEPFIGPIYDRYLVGLDGTEDLIPF